MKLAMVRLVQFAVGAVALSFGSCLWATEIRWSGEYSCRREREVVEQIESMTARPVSSVEIADFELSVKSLARQQWSLELTTVRRADAVRSARVIHGASCAEVTDAAAVAIALAIGPSADQGKIEPESRPTPSVQAPPEAPRPRPRDLPPARSSLEWFAGLAGALDSSATPAPAFGASVRLGWSGLPSEQSQTRLRLELEGAFYAPTQTGDVGGQAGKFQLAYGAPLICGAKPLGGPTLLGCVGAEFGQLSGEGVGDAVTTSHPSNTFWSAARAELGLSFPLATALRVLGRAGVAVPLIRREFVLDGPDVVFRTAPISARFGLGVELSL